MCIGHTIRHFVKTQHQEYPLWHFANRYVFQCLKRRMAIRHFVKTENSLAKRFARHINSVLLRNYDVSTLET